MRRPLMMACCSALGNRKSTGITIKIAVLVLTLPMMRLLSSKAQELKIFENHQNPILSVFIGKLSLCTLK